jgi:hypothetical protein
LPPLASKSNFFKERVFQDEKKRSGYSLPPASIIHAAAAVNRQQQQQAIRVAPER